MQDKVVLVGCGNMGFAMLRGWLDSGILKAGDVHVVEPAEALRERAALAHVHVYADAAELPADLQPRMALVAVKPQMMANVLPAYKRFAPASTFVSVAAGIPVALFESHLGKDVAVIRCMPNTPAAIGKGMLVTFKNANVSDTNEAFVTSLLKTSGKVASVDEEGLMDAVTAVSGSGPAYIFHFIEALTDAGVSLGLPRETAALLAMQTVMGAGALADASTDSPSKLREQVTSPNGTTAAALDVLMGGDRLKELVAEAVKAAHKRSVELGKS
ncbi:pyrroline-5-carboxylate reductase [Brucella sp. 10RB9214]|uniref:pyrroline-5-carboxylate reductase n=1 Tax=unclassified Brucella TaxID=2632610 RepID=UPI000972A694|nr:MULTISPECIES: pyrroline-5-carboxylate reductase [unclassified Brucella]APY15656.1 pyrroline-5-carboxylate reductase [Brucella sp. 09RB8910]MRN45277.1 pyrroline-5-carboxylate reductase [Brucella sp. 10RB9212]MRN48754.1 pyrroline-5-carboxylate reductase [Brucella sp. 10RB9214]